MGWGKKEQQVGHGRLPRGRPGRTPQCVTATQGPDGGRKPIGMEPALSLGVQRLGGAQSPPSNENQSQSLSPSPCRAFTTLPWTPAPDVLTQTAATCHPSHTYSGLEATSTDSSFLFTKLPARGFRASFPQSVL